MQAPHPGTPVQEVAEHASSPVPNQAILANPQPIAESGMETVPPPVAQDLSGWLLMDPMGTESASASTHLADQSHVNSGHATFASLEEAEVHPIDDEADEHEHEAEALDLNDLD